MKSKQKEAKDMAKRIELQNEMLTEAQEEAASATATVAELREALQAAKAEAAGRSGSAGSLAKVLRRTISSSVASSASNADAGGQKSEPASKPQSAQDGHGNSGSTIRALQEKVAALQSQLVRSARLSFAALWWNSSSAFAPITGAGTAASSHTRLRGKAVKMSACSQLSAHAARSSHAYH